MSYCYLHQALGRLRPECGDEEEEPRTRKEGEERGGRGKGGGGDHELRFDSTGVIIEGVIPVFAFSVAGKGGKVRSYGP